jgi:hypothetical protein
MIRGYRALFANTTGSENTATGMNALLNNSSGANNTAVGARSLGANTTGSDNTAVGQQAGAQGGERNTAIGSAALLQGSAAGNEEVTAVGFEALRTSDGEHNSALGATALRNLSTGNRNIAVGHGAGINLTSGIDNIYVGSPGVLGDDGTIRIGRLQTTRAFMAGVRGVTTGANNAVGVVIDSNGQLGTVSSSRRTKFDIQDLDDGVTTALHQLRPVQFRYVQAFADGDAPLQYGLIAEEVHDVMPELVATDSEGQPATVKYHCAARAAAGRRPAPGAGAPGPGRRDSGSPRGRRRTAGAVGRDLDSAATLTGAVRIRVADDVFGSGGT